MSPRPGTGPAAERALVANLNVFTAPGFDPRTERVRSWAWSDGPAPADLERDAARALRVFPDGGAIAAAYVAGKRMLDGDGRRSVPRALPWLIREVRAARRVLVGAARPSGGRDQALWALLIAAACLTRTPLHVYSETWLAPAGRRNAPRRALDRALAAVATAILVPGRAQAAHYRRLGHGAKVHVIPAPYAPAPAPAPADGTTRRRASTVPELLFVGRVMPLKGLDRLIDLVDRLDAEGRRLRLVALLADPGLQHRGGPPGYAEACLSRLRARDPALTEIHVTDVDVDAFFRRASLLVMPNRLIARDRVPGESWGRVVPEALFAGLPIVSTDAVPSAVEHVVSGVNGTLVPWADDAALAAAVRDWLGW
ncbi:MAG TPA: glycosyltransferase [Baekduia sp.]|jgi:glycosyltransferase involved in cell wall biosynthesis